MWEGARTWVHSGTGIRNWGTLVAIASLFAVMAPVG